MTEFKPMRKLLSFLLFLALIVLPLDLKVVCPGEQETVPQQTETIPESSTPEAPVIGENLLTHDNILLLLDEADPDGAFLLRSTEERNDFMEWFDASETVEKGIDRFETAVHEQCHRYCSIPQGVRYNSVQGRYMAASEWIYIGNGQKIEVPLTDVFPSSDMAGAIPESLRTFRFDTYIAGDLSMASIQYGPYGLLDEFTAYCWGVHSNVVMEKYRKKDPNVITYIGDFTAYAEFRFYILRYLLYAKEHNPGVYAGILDNEAFREAFTCSDRQFADYAEARKNERYMDEWNVLMEEMQKPEYVERTALLAE